MASGTVNFPQFVAFKGDNGAYLGSMWSGGHPYQQFFATDIASERVRFEVVPVREEEGHGTGLVRIKSLYQDCFWRRSPNWIWADTPADGLDTSNKDLIFLPVLVDFKTVALKCLGNNAFCSRLTADYKNDCLNASAWSMEKTAQLRVEEPVIRRTVRNVVYDTGSAVIAVGELLTLATSKSTNNTDKPATAELSFTYSDKRSRSWSNSVSFTTGVSATFTAGIPEVVSGGVTVSTEITSATEFGQTEEKEKTVGTEYTVTVDPGKTIKVDLQASLAKCDVKFSYEQEDLLTTGKTVTITKNDGLYKGANYINLTYASSYV